MNDILNIVLLAAAVIFLLLGAYFLIRALRSRMGVTEQSYGVAKQEARQVTLVNVTRGIFFLIVALIVFAVLSLIPSSEAESPAATMTATPEQEPSRTRSATSTPEITRIVDTPTSTTTIPSRTPFPTDTPEPTNTPVLPSAIVNSPNGLWLREAPGGDQELELIPNGAVLILLQGLELADEFEWQEVRTQSGNVGWVAVEFIEYQQ